MHNERLRHGPINSCGAVLGLILAIGGTDRMQAATLPAPQGETRPALAAAGVMASGSKQMSAPETASAPNVPNRAAKVPSIQPSALTDQQMEMMVRRALHDNPRTRAFAPQSSVTNGCVILAGRTYYLADRDLAERTVSKLPGIRALQDQIIVLPNADLEIAQRLHQAFSADPLIDDAGIGVTVIRRKVFLSGSIDSADKLARVNEIVQSVPGVLGVSNGLQVSATATGWRAPQTPRYSVYQRPHR